jgi:hypothetical protein
MAGLPCSGKRLSLVTFFGKTKESNSPFRAKRFSTAKLGKPLIFVPQARTKDTLEGKLNGALLHH